MLITPPLAGTLFTGRCPQVALWANLKHPSADETKWHVPLAPGVGQNSRNYWSLQMNDSNNSSKGLLVLRYPQELSQARLDLLAKAITPLADELGVEPLVLDDGADARLEYGSSALLERVCVALEALVAQGTPPEINVAEIAPQALNARPSELNSRDPFRYGSDKHRG